MKSRTTERFRKRFAELPAEIQIRTKKAFAKFKEYPYYPSLNYKRVHSTRPVYAVRITKDYRAVGVIQNNEIIWFWIGSHSDYDKLLKQLKNN